MLADGAVHGRRIEALALELGVFVVRGLDGDAMPALALAEPRSARVEYAVARADVHEGPTNAPVEERTINVGRAGVARVCRAIRTAGVPPARLAVIGTASADART